MRVGPEDHEDDAARLLFVARARHLGLSCEQIADLLPVWDGSNCAAAQVRVEELIVEKQNEIRRRIKELRAFGAELDAVREALHATAPPSACRTDLSCCMPATEREPVLLELTPRS